MEKELVRLYNATDDGNVFPSRAANSFSVKKETNNGVFTTEDKHLTGAEYVRYAGAKGKMSYDIVTALTKSAMYKTMSDTDKAKAVDMAYDYANAIAKTKVSAYKPEGWIAKAYATCNATGMNVDTYLLLHMKQNEIDSIRDDDGNAITNSKSLLVMEMLYNTKGLTTKQREALYGDFNVGEKVRKYNPALVERKLERIRN
jgi:hypothetical protein